MSEADHMDVSTAEESNQARKSSSPKQNTREDVTENSLSEHLGSPPEDAIKNGNIELLGQSPKDAAKNFEDMAIKRTAKLVRKKYKLRSSISSTRLLRPRSKEKPKAPEPSDNLVNTSGGRERKRRKEKMKKKTAADEFGRIRKHLRYLLNRMSYERSLIDAYSAEGWKGQSVEKLKPERELQRASSEIARRKLKIRDLFQHLDSLCAEGRFPESLFDSEGQIDSEDIFCVKCGSKEMSTDNDIILCDGACDRGFHQFCLEPPLLKEDIPPDDEGWLCPACDCKVDCVDLLNDSEGTELAVTDSWEKVFPEVAAAAAGGNKDNSSEFPSDDSEDDDYDPDSPEIDEKDHEDDSTSDESDFTSASEDFTVPKNNDLGMGLPSDDSEDDDYNPDAPDLDEQVKQGSSSSDFTSDSEDFAATFDDEKVSNKEVGFHGQAKGKKKVTLKDELLSVLESNAGQDNAPISAKRHVERLDYKKLHDEEYGNVSSASSDDEDWADDILLRKQKHGSGDVASVSPPNGKTSITENGSNTRDIKHKLEASGCTAKQRTRPTQNLQGTTNSPERSQTPGSTCRNRQSPYKKLGEAVSEALYKSFQESQYPERATKEKLAQELGITVRQVSKWFENARWSFRHRPNKEASAGKSSTKEAITVKSPVKKDVSPAQTYRSPMKNDVSPSQTNGKLNQEMATREASNNGAEKKESSPKVSAAKAVEHSSRAKRGMKFKTTPKSRKRNAKSSHEASDATDENLPKTSTLNSRKQKTSNHAPDKKKMRKCPSATPKPQDEQSDRIQTRSRKSSA